MVVGSMPILGVVLALVSAAILAVANLWQSKGVTQATADASGAASMLQLLKTPVWLAGSGLFGVSIVLQMGSLAFAPLILVQPIGVTALVFTTLLTAKNTGRKPSREIINAVIISLVGVVTYVVVAAIVSTQKPITDEQLVEILSALGAVLLAALIMKFAIKGIKPAPVLFIILGGTFSGFVATLGKTVMLRVEDMFKGGELQWNDGSWLTLICLLGLAIASVLSIYFVQFSHTCNPPDVVIAGLTVIDPAIAVVLGITILKEAEGAPAWSILAFIVAGGVSMWGVFKLAKAESNQSDQTQTNVVERSAQRSAENG